jgi:hypothetical protein
MVSMPVPVVNMSESFRRSRPCFQCFRFAVSRRGIRHQRFQQMMRSVRDFIDRAIESVLVCFRWLGESAQLSNELQRRRPNLIIRRWR